MASLAPNLSKFLNEHLLRDQRVSKSLALEEVQAILDAPNTRTWVSKHHTATPRCWRLRCLRRSRRAAAVATIRQRIVAS